MSLRIRRLTLRFLLLLAAGAATLGFACVATAVSRDPGGVILDHISIAGVPVGGLGPGTALSRLRVPVRKALRAEAQFAWEGGTLRPSLADLGISADIAAAVQSALALGNETDLLETIRSRVEVMRLGRDIPVPLLVDEGKLRAWLVRAAQDIDRPPRDANIRLAEQQVSVEPEKPGRKLSVEGSLHAIVSALGALGEPLSADLVVEAQEPRIRAADLEGVEVLGEFTTRFKAYQSNRNHNIALGAQAIDGTVVMPGEVFSLNGATGRRTVSKGYRVAPVYSGKKVVMGIGGGMCQVSSTTYNAARRAGMTIVERHPHSLPVFYVPSGMDATVAWEAADLKFRNDLSRPVIVKAWVSGSALTVAVLGGQQSPTPATRAQPPRPTAASSDQGDLGRAVEPLRPAALRQR